MDLIYFQAGRSKYAVGVGLLFGQGTIWFLGALVADYRDVLRQSRAARWHLGFGGCCWPAILDVVWQRVHLQVVYLVVLGLAFSLMLIRFVVTDLGHVGGTPRRPREY